MFGWGVLGRGKGGLLTLDHAQAGTKDGDEGDGVGGDLGGFVFEAEGGFFLWGLWSGGFGKRGRGEQTVGPGMAKTPLARASQPTMSEISWIRPLTSLALVLPERSWLSFARRHGCLETCTLGGSWVGMAAVVVVVMVVGWFPVLALSGRMASVLSR